MTPKILGEAAIDASSVLPQQATNYLSEVRRRPSVAAKIAAVVE